MIPALTKDNYRVENAKMAINYGSDKVRFIAAVPSGGRIRARSELIDATKVDDNTVNLTVKNTIELTARTNPPRSPRRSCGCCSRRLAQCNSNVWGRAQASHLPINETHDRFVCDGEIVPQDTRSDDGR